MEVTTIAISLIGGFCAGVINTFAGFGSIITLGIYMDLLGIPGHLANATNRVNVLSSSSVSAFTFRKNNKLDLAKNKWLIISVFIGAMIGVYMATIVDAEGFKKIFNYLLFPIFLLLVLNPKRFITPDPTKAITSPYITFPLYFLIGIYAGFIQAGFGVLFLMIAVMLSKYDLVESNGLKIACVAIYSLAIVLIFQLKGMIIWQAGIAIAIGQMFGGYFAANNLTRFKGANILVYRLLIAIIFLVILRNWGILDVIIGYAI